MDEVAVRERLTGTAVLRTGAGWGIGRATALRCATWLREVDGGSTL